MNRDPILFRVDATPETGYEHLVRCLIYAAALQRRRRPTYFLAQLEPASLGLAIKRAGNDWLEADGRAGSEEDAAEVVQEIRRLGTAGIIVDAPEATSPYLAEIQSTGALLVSVDHHAQIRFPSKLVINPLLGPGKEAYEFVPGTQLLLGGRYGLVRSEIRRLRAGRAQEPAPLPSPNGKGRADQYRALVALGDDDPNQQTLELTRTLLNSPRVGRVDVVVRHTHPDLEKLQSLAEANSERLEIALEMAEITGRITRCHFALTSGSSWSLELACVGIPQLLIVQNEAHWPTAQRLEEEGCATCLGWYASVSTTTIRQAVQNLLGDPLERQSMSRCARNLIDGRGCDRLVTALEILLHTSRPLDYSEAA
jgi:spore coat polysaccharide biosynthesis predicted glycosyltransferase SpsG